MANEHFFSGDFSGLSMPFSSAHVAPDTSATAAAFGFHWVDPPADSSATAHFDSALSSLVSSPANGGPAPEDEVAIGDLIGRLGSICNGGTNSTSCYSTPLNSPPRGPHAMPPFSGLATRSYGGLLETGKLSRVSSSKSLVAAAGSMAMALKNIDQLEMEMSSKLASPMPGTSPPAMPEASVKANGESNARKRKASAKGKGKEAPLAPSTVNSLAEDNPSPKRSKLDGIKGNESTESEKNSEAGREEEESNGNGKAVLEPPKEYIHVRARRGQATDSHSLAERVRRERISERMKMLQSLVPGCNKVTGKAVMLDEIINYVQSLQCQVEFLSMKLATMNPQFDSNAHYLQSKDMHQAAMPVYLSEDVNAAFSYPRQPQDNLLHTANPLDASLHHGLASKLPPLEGFGDAVSQVGAFWEQDLQSVVQMGIGQNQEAALSSQSFYGQAPVNHVKLEP